MATLVQLEDVRRAREEIAGRVRFTPLLPCEELSAETRSQIAFKCENLQITGSYKVRAAFTVLLRLSAQEKARGAALSSSGNFAGAFAFAGRELGVRTTLVMMRKTSPFKAEKTRKYGGEVVFCDNRYEARFETLDRLRRERSLTVVNHLENHDVIAGHGTIGLEIAEQFQDVDVVVVPVSTGGLIAGVATAIKGLSPRVRVIGVQPVGSNAASLSFRAGEVVRIPEAVTICDALTATSPGPLPWEHMRHYVDDMVTVTDEEVTQAVAYLAENAKLVVEPGGAVGVAALIRGHLGVTGRKVAVILSGGNVAPAPFARWILEREASRATKDGD
ncbi:MAG: threonine/serine dehydratase [Acidobacteria bacterium]|nr:threonine/serine dehydratase [Acidobacteriota bacterium]